MTAQESFELIQLWIFAIEHELVAPADWMAWAERTLDGEAHPELWVIELIDAPAREPAVAMLWDAHIEARTAGTWLEKLPLLLGTLFALFRKGRRPLADMLLEAGEAADGANASDPSCEAYFELLNQLDAGRSPADVAIQAWPLFERPFAYARAQLARIGVDLA